MARGMTMDFTAEQLLEIVREECLEGHVVDIVEDGDWDDEGKYQHSFTIFKYKDKHYKIDYSRSGSYYSDYYYSYENTPLEAYGVTKMTRTETYWG